MLRFVVALGAEARPLVERYRLERVPGGGLPVFRRGGTALVVSGVGKEAAAAAVAHLHRAAAGDVPPGGPRGEGTAWINVGIAGHRRRRPGEAVLAREIRDLASGRAWTPTRLAPPPCPLDVVLTVDRPETAFREAAAYEMEASGFYPAASRVAGPGLVHCLKVISDGPGTDPATLTARRVAALIEGRLGTVERLVERCLSPPPGAANGAARGRSSRRAPATGG